ncbi:hypothetical protein Celaphus_00002627 [Cervus elaphus hippelaphus]|uniref:Uncharacterized protein n=1 Tax=Cervus elaphus hippelaphus TaxID=46360 RepID=A0A212CF39_CEREH|nr:hypothetical protein Celaphus_00002627 [Cervus elaphus hippelaphus]
MKTSLRWLEGTCGPNTEQSQDSSIKGQVLWPAAQPWKLLAHDAEVPEHTMDAPMELNDTYGTENSAAPEAELCAPLTAREEDSQKESMQNQVKNLLTHDDDLYMS